MNENQKISVDKILEDNDFEFFHIDNIINFTKSASRKGKGKLNLSIVLPSDVVKSDVENLPQNDSEYELIPLILFVKSKSDNK